MSGNPTYQELGSTDPAPAKPQGVHRISSRVTSFVIFSCSRITVTISSLFA
jgi:hypothetical protein